MSIIMWEAAMSYTKRMKRIIANWEPYLVVYFQNTLVSQRHSPVLVKKCATQDASVWLQLLASPLTK